MRIATWNVNNGDLVARLFRLVERFHPHIAVITEAPKPISNLPNVQWVKDSETRGIAVYAAPGFSIKAMTPKPLHRCVHGYQISGARSFSLLACWSHPGTIKDDYREYWMNGIPKYGKYLKGKNVVIAVISMIALSGMNLIIHIRQSKQSFTNFVKSTAS